MKVGITLLWFDAILKELRNKSESNDSFFDYSKVAEKAVDKGFNHIELTMNMYYLLPYTHAHFTKENIQRLAIIKKEKNITFSVHLPFWSIELASFMPGIREASVRAIIEPVEALEKLNPITYVLHPVGASAAEFHRSKIPNEDKRVLIQMLAHNARSSLQQVVAGFSNLGIDSRRIALETVEFPFTETLRIAEDFNTSMCIDIGHILAGYPGDVNIEQALKRSSGRIAEIHVHDVHIKVERNCTIVKDHLPLGSGELDVNELLKWVQLTGFDGPIVLEHSFEDAEVSIQRIRTTAENLTKRYA